MSPLSPRDFEDIAVMDDGELREFKGGEDIAKTLRVIEMLDIKIFRALKDYMGNEEFAERCLSNLFPQERREEYEEVCSFITSHSAGQIADILAGCDITEGTIANRERLLEKLSLGKK